MKAYIQHKHADSLKTWEEIPQDEMYVGDEREARIFARALANYLKEQVRLVLNHENGSGIYYAPVQIVVSDWPFVRNSNVENTY